LGGATLEILILFLKKFFFKIFPKIFLAKKFVLMRAIYPEKINFFDNDPVELRPKHLFKNFSVVLLLSLCPCNNFFSNHMIFGLT
jgi:hypothetical protein